MGNSISDNNIVIQIRNGEIYSVGSTNKDTNYVIVDWDSDDSKVGMDMHPVDYTINDLSGFLEDLRQGYY